MKFKVDSGLELVASDWGNVNDPLVVLMHGGGQTRHAWGSTCLLYTSPSPRDS